MKKTLLSLITLMVLGTSTGFCGTKSNTNRNGNQPKTEQIVSNRSVHNDNQVSNPTGNQTGRGTYQMQGNQQKDKKNEYNCKNCQKQKKQPKKQCTCKQCQKQQVQVGGTQSHGKIRK